MSVFSQFAFWAVDSGYVPDRRCKINPEGNHPDGGWEAGTSSLRKADHAGQYR